MTCQPALANRTFRPASGRGEGVTARYRIVTGQSQQPMMMLVGDSLRAVVIVMCATSMGATGSQLYWTLTDGTATAIVGLVTNSATGPFQKIGDNLAEMQIAMSTIDIIEDAGNSNIASDLARDKWMSGIGVAGPAVIAGSLLLLNKVALALFIGLGRCSSSACCSSRPRRCSRNGCSTASAPCSHWPCSASWSPSP